MSRTLIVFAIVVLTGRTALAGDPIVSFDVPALVEAGEVESTSLNPGLLSTSQKIIRVVVPVSTSINNMTVRDDISEFRFDVGWNQSVFPLVDYGPRTQTTAGIEGTIGVQKQEESHATFDFGFAGKPGELASIDLNADAGQRTSSQLTFQEIPQHQLLVASGTIDRGTGAFFRFHRSKKETLEGGKELVLSFRVPQGWKNGLLKIRCLATGSKRIVGPWKEPLSSEMEFVVPLYLEGDSDSQQLAIGFVGAEQELRRTWNVSKQQSAKSSVAAGLSNLFQPSSDLPWGWLEQFILSGDDQWLDQYQNRLSQEVAVAAGKFLQSRSQLRHVGR